MRSQMQSSPDDIDITSLWSVLKRNGSKILLVSAILGLGTFGVLSLLPTKYSSEAQLQISGQGANDPFRDPRLGNNSSAADTASRVDKEAIASQVVALKSRDLAKKLIDELKLQDSREFNKHLGSQGIGGTLLSLVGLAGPRSGETPEETTLANYYKALQIAQVRDTRVINIEFSSSNNDLAATAANRLAELYQEWLRTRVVTETEDASKWLKPQIEKLAKEVAQAEADVERFRSKANLFRGSSASGAGSNLNEQQLSDLTTEMTKARAARSEAEARSRSARELMQRGLADAITEVQKSPVIQGLIAQRTRAERDKAEAETTLLSGHPRMKQLNANVTDLRRQVNKEAQLIVEGLEKEAKALALREELAQKNLDSVKSVVGNKAGEMAELAALEGLAKAKRSELESLQLKEQAARTRGGDVRSVPLEAQIISKAVVSNVPSSPKRMQHSLLAAVAGLILGFASVILKELFSSARRNAPGEAAASIQPAPSAASRVATAVAPAAPASRSPVATAVRSAPVVAAAAAPLSRAVEVPAAPAQLAQKSSPPSIGSADAIARRLIANAGAQGGYRTVITGSASQVLGREEAVDLASALVAEGKQVALVDWCVDGHGLSADLGIEPAPGLMDLLGGGASFEDVIRRLPEGDVHVVPCGAARVAGLAGESDRINLVLDALDEAYDHIVVTGDNASVRELFLAIQGRFDAAVVVSDSGHIAPANEFGEGVFLGFQVTDIDVIKLDRDAGPALQRPKMQLARTEVGEARA